MNSGLETRLRKYMNGPAKRMAFLATVDVEAGSVPEVRPISLMECDWRFYLATTKNSRKAKELLSFPKAAVLVHLRDEKHSGYLRMTGKIEIIEDLDLRRTVTQATKYPVDHHGGVASPTFFFARINPDRVEFMEPGEDVATDVTRDFESES